MRRLVITALAFILAGSVFAQGDSTKPKPKPQPRAFSSSDHFLMQFGYTTWLNQPDSIHTNGFPRTFNIYLMLDFPFKTDPHWSIALGPGVATDNIYFSKTYIGLKDNTAGIRFQDLSDTSHFRKYKLATAFVEAPIELRFRSNPGNDRSSFKAALGVKVGTMIDTHVKGKDFQSAAGTTLLDYILKEKSKHFMNRNRLLVMGRVGVGHWTAFASYSVTPVFKEGLGPVVRPLTLGITLSGL
ncbi:MAG: hypothetical protein ACJ75B_19340 [Flavisolibacter sp.]